MQIYLLFRAVVFVSELADAMVGAREGTSPASEAYVQQSASVQTDDDDNYNSCIQI